MSWDGAGVARGTKSPAESVVDVFPPLSVESVEVFPPLVEPLLFAAAFEALPPFFLVPTPTPTPTAIPIMSRRTTPATIHQSLLDRCFLAGGAVADVAMCLPPRP